MFGYLYEIIGAGVGEEIHPFLWVKCGSGKVLDEVIVDMVWAVGCEVVLARFTSDAPPRRAAIHRGVVRRLGVSGS